MASCKGKTVEEIKARLEAEEMAAEEGQTFKGYPVADLRKVFNKVKDQRDWKAPWAAAVPHQIVGLVLAAAEFFHGDMAKVVVTSSLDGKVMIRGKGYQC